jgi:hypothetical protein
MLANSDLMGVREASIWAAVLIGVLRALISPVPRRGCRSPGNIRTCSSPVLAIWPAVTAPLMRVSQSAPCAGSILQED